MNYTTFCKTLVIASMTAALALAQPPGRGFGPPSGQGSAAAAPTLDNAKQYLGLSDTDVVNLESLRKASMEEIQPLAKQLHEQQQALQQAIRSGSATASTIGTATLAIETLKKQIEAKGAAAQAQAVASLTPAQQAKLKALEAVVALAPTVREANILGLVTPPEGMGRGGAGGPGGPGGRGAGERGPGGRGPGF